MKFGKGISFDTFIRLYNPKPRERFTYVENGIVFNSFINKQGTGWDYNTYTHPDGRTYTTDATPESCAGLNFRGSGLITEYFPHRIRVSQFVPD